GNVREIRVGRKNVLVEARQFGLIIPSEAQRSISENTLAINDVPNHFLDAPLAGSVFIVCVFLANLPKQRAHSTRLSLQDGDHIGLNDQIDITPEVCSVFRWRRSTNNRSRHGSFPVPPIRLS